MNIYDISMTIEENMQVYKNKEEKKPRFQITRDYNTSDGMESKIALDMHTGTHLDMPLHFVKEGDSVETLSLKRVVRNCKVLDFSHLDESITAKDLQSKSIETDDFLLLKTKNSNTDRFDPEFVYLTAEGAQYLLDHKVAGVGIDALGIERDQPDHDTHGILLGNDILILEGLRLMDVEEGSYFLSALPLKIKGAEASPIRAILMEF
ncbi:MAG TPA: cyclase [Eubacteriaceae bacterium]|nr:cyclase [Eubacteriaceae bacterium]